MLAQVSDFLPPDHLSTASAVETLTMIAVAAGHDQEIIRRTISLILNTGGITEGGSCIPKRTINRLVRDNVLQPTRIAYQGPTRYTATPRHRAALLACRDALRSLPGAALPHSAAPPP